MKNVSHSESENKSANNSDLKNLPESCAYCGYRTKPSSASDSCLEYCKKAFQRKTETA